MNPDDLLVQFGDWINAHDGRELPDDIELFEAVNKHAAALRAQLAETEAHLWDTEDELAGTKDELAGTKAHLADDRDTCPACGERWRGTGATIKRSHGCLFGERHGRIYHAACVEAIEQQEAQLAEAQRERQREHDLRVTLAGTVESYQDVLARVRAHCVFWLETATTPGFRPDVAKAELSEYILSILDAAGGLDAMPGGPTTTGDTD